MASEYPNLNTSPYFYGPVVIGTSPVRLVAKYPDRRALIVANNSSSEIFLGFDNGVEAGHGIPIKANSVWTDAGFRDNFTGEIWAVASSAGLDIRIAWWVR